jgi:tRNA A58 N-methylase Trm61
MDLPRIFTSRESKHRIHNPLTPDKLAALGQALHLAPGTRVLDLASGSGEMLCTWARDLGFTGTGVDISTGFTEQARARAIELGVADRVEFVHGDASVMSRTSRSISPPASAPPESGTASPERPSCSVAVSAPEG